MEFETKKEIIDKARQNYLSFDDYFKDILGSGMSTSGAYSIIDLTTIDKHRTLNELKLWDTATAAVRAFSPIRLHKHSIVSKLEELNERLGNS